MNAQDKADARRASEEARDALKAAVDDLTAPKTVPNWQGKKLTHRTDPPLLEALHAAVGSSVGGGSGGGKLGFERSSIDLAAFTLLEEIDGRARSWMVELGAQPGKSLTPSQVLRAWFTMWASTHHEPADHDRRRKVLDGWAHRIENVIDPPRRIELGGTSAVRCPSCGEDYVLDGQERPDGEIDLDAAGWRRALAVYEKGRLAESFAECGACGARWEGEDGLRWLRILIDEAEASGTASELALDYPPDGNPYDLHPEEG